MNLKIFCMTVKNLNVLNKLPKYIVPFGLGDSEYPGTWLNEKTGNNIRNLNKFYGEVTGMYWIWKNYMDKVDQNDWIGFCQYRRLWLNELLNFKQKKDFKSLYSGLLKVNNDIFSSCNSILLQPTIITRQNLKEQFGTLYGKNIIDKCINFIKEKDRDDFNKFLSGNKISICNMFITKPKIFTLYFQEMFEWIEQCYMFCSDNNLLNDKNLRLPVFMVERFTSFWFEKYTDTNYLSFARLGNFFLSNKINRFINPLKLPLTFRMYPTIHKY